VTLSDLPALNATLNGSAAILLLIGYRFIRRGEIQRHRATMLSACAIRSGTTFASPSLNRFHSKVRPERGRRRSFSAIMAHRASHAKPTVDLLGCYRTELRRHHDAPCHAGGSEVAISNTPAHHNSTSTSVNLTSVAEPNVTGQEWRGVQENGR
jgi:hypothetical protein